MDIPKDVQKAVADWDYDSLEIRLPGYTTVPNISKEDLENAVELITTARKPIILAGQGILLGNAAHLLREFAEKYQIPVAVTLLGISALPANHPLYLGMMGLHGDAWANQAIQKSDLIIALGMRFDDRATGSLDNFAPHAKKIHIDIDRTEINKNVSVDLGIITDLKDALEGILRNLEAQNHSAWIDEIQADRKSGEEQDFIRIPDDGILHAIHVINDLWELTNKNAIVVTDVGQHQMWAAQYYKFDQPYTSITSGGLGTMGFALPAAIGAKFARPERDVWVIMEMAVSK